MTESLAPEPVKIDDDHVSVRIADLLIGSELRFPLCNTSGILLVAEGTTITSQLKKRIASYGSENVRIHAADVGRVTLTASEVDGRVGLGVDSELVAKIDKIVNQGQMFVKNEGPPMRDEMAVNGPKAYDSDQKEELEQQHQTTSDALNVMMDEVASGRSLDGQQVTKLVAKYVSDLAKDKDLVLNIALMANKEGLTERSLQTALLSMTIGVEMGFDAGNVQLLGICGLLHDWGMTKVPEEIVSATGPLTRLQFLEIQKHPIHSIDMLNSITGIPGLVPLVVFQVHERLDGSGYPRGRQSSAIHPLARILQVADNYTALTSPRNYAKPVTAYGAVECLLHLASERVLDSKVITALLNAFSLFPIGSFVTLDDGSIAQVLRANRGRFNQPVVQLVRNSQGEKIAPSDETVVDLTNSELSVVQAIPTPGRDEVVFSPEVLTGSASYQFQS